jgi:N6-adenosine-specific RNA methylase IME4
VAPFRVVLADPPWAPDDRLPGKTRGAAKNYDVLSVQEICDYPLPPIADDALLLLWRIASMPEEALRVCRAWGFVPKSEIVWVKTTESGGMVFGMGRYVRASHEVCIIGGRGRASSKVIDHSIPSVFLAPRRGHSEKPEEVYEIATRLFPGPRVELFARGAPRSGWTRYGREAMGVPESPAREGVRDVE